MILEMGEAAAEPNSGDFNIRQLGIHLARLRQARNLSQRGLAEVAGIPHRTISRLEKGDHTNPTLRTLLALQRALGLASIEQLLGGIARFPSDAFGD